MTRRLLLIDDHPLFRNGFAAMLGQFRSDWVLSLASSASEGCALLTADKDIELAIVDIQLPDGDGFAAIARMRAIAPTLRCIVISGREDSAARVRAVACGASAFIGKTDAAEDMLATLDKVLSGQRPFDQDKRSAMTAPSLSARQGEVLALLAQGHANKEIRYRLGIAERTVRAHLTDLFGLLGVSSRMQALLKARELGLID